jgi:hypothetical protein
MELDSVLNQDLLNDGSDIQEGMERLGVPRFDAMRLILLHPYDPAGPRVLRPHPAVTLGDAVGPEAQFHFNHAFTALGF